jgi:hypothetical protein
MLVLGQEYASHFFCPFRGSVLMGRAKAHKHFRGFSTPARDRDILRSGQHSSFHDALVSKNRLSPRLSRPSGTTNTRTNQNRNSGK